jgi:hypothetical protein
LRAGQREKRRACAGLVGGSHGFSLDFFFGSFLFYQEKRNEHNTESKM